MEIKQIEENIHKKCQLNEIQQEFLKQQIEVGFSDEQIKKYGDFASLSKEELVDYRREYLLSKKLPEILESLNNVEKIDENLKNQLKQFYEQYVLKTINESIKLLEQLLDYELNEQFEGFYAIVEDKCNALNETDKIQLLKKIYEISINFYKTIQNDQKLEVELEKIAQHLETHEENMECCLEYLQLAIDKEFLFVFDLKEESIKLLKKQYKNWNIHQFLLCWETYYERRNQLDKKVEVQLEYLKLFETFRQNQSTYKSEKLEVLRKICQTYRRLNNHGEESKFLKEALKIDEFNKELNEQYWENQKIEVNQLEANRLQNEFQIKQLGCQENITNFLINQGNHLYNLEQQKENYQKEFANYVVEQNLKYQKLTEEFSQKLERLEEKDKSQLEEQRKKNQKLEEQNQNNSKLLEEQSQKYEKLLEQQKEINEKAFKEMSQENNNFKLQLHNQKKEIIFMKINYKIRKALDQIKTNRLKEALIILDKLLQKLDETKQEDQYFIQKIIRYKGQIYFKQDQLNEAQQSYLQSISINSKFYKEQQNIDQAINYFCLELSFLKEKQFCKAFESQKKANLISQSIFNNKHENDFAQTMIKHKQLLHLFNEQIIFFSLNSLVNNAQGKIYSANGNLIFEGELVNYSMEGNGKTFQDQTQEVYQEGLFRNGQLWKGKEFDNNKNHVKTFENGQVKFDGDFQNGQILNGKEFDSNNYPIKKFKNGQIKYEYVYQKWTKDEILNKCQENRQQDIWNESHEQRRLEFANNTQLKWTYTQYNYDDDDSYYYDKCWQYDWDQGRKAIFFEMIAESDRDKARDMIDKLANETKQPYEFCLRIMFTNFWNYKKSYKNLLRIQ